MGLEFLCFNTLVIQLGEHREIQLGLPEIQKKERKKSIAQLPDGYAVVKPKALRVKEPAVGGAEIKKSEMMCDSEVQQAK